jgi:6-phosphogluconolactonase
VNTLYFETEDAAVNAVCSGIKDQLETDLDTKGAASLILTGGKTIQPFLSKLALMPIDWSKVWIVLSDERWVPVDDHASNEKQLKSLFLDKLSSNPHYVTLKTDHKTPAEAIPSLEACLKKVPQPFSASLLSIGEDGHVASLFPGEKWSNMLIPCVYMSRMRISLGIDIFKNCIKNWSCITKVRYEALKRKDFEKNPKYPLKHFLAQVVVF